MERVLAQSAAPNCEQRDPPSTVLYGQGVGWIVADGLLNLGKYASGIKIYLTEDDGEVGTKEVSVSATGVWGDLLSPYGDIPPYAQFCLSPAL